MRPWLLASGLLLLACQREPSNNLAAGMDSADQANEAAAPPPPDADVDASLNDLNMPAPPDAEPPDSTGTPRFVGRWAAEEGMCASSAWEFTETRLETPAGSVCRFTNVREVPGGYDIDARCTAEAPERDDLLRLRFAESAGGLLFESQSIADAGLIRCGR